MRDILLHNVVSNSALIVGGGKGYRDEFPLGEGWYEMNIDISEILTVGTGTGAIAEGELLFVKNVMVKTDTDGLILNLPGRALYYLDAFKQDCVALPYKDAMAAASATYRVNLTIPFVNWKRARPEDTILDTSRYRNVEVYVTLGTVADLLTTPGTASVTATCNISIKKTTGVLPAAAKPLMIPYFGFYPPVDPANQQYIEIEKSPTLAVEEIFLFAGNTGSGFVAGLPFSTVGNNATLASLQLEFTDGFAVRAMPAAQLQAIDKLIYNATAAWPTGWYALNFCEDKSVFSALSTGDKTKLQMNWVNGSLSTSQVNTMICGLRPIQVR